jgi:hypothetical protein
VVADPEVKQLMEHNVIDERRLGHHYPPIEAQGAIRAAASPPLALVAGQDSWRSCPRMAAHRSTRL